MTKTVKGSHIVQAQKWIDDRLGPGTFTEMTKEAGDNWRLIIPVAWYEVEVLNRALVQTSRRLGVSVAHMTAEIARLNAENDLTTLYRVFLRVAQPQRVLVHTPRLWRTYVSFGDAKAVMNEPGHYVGQGDGFDQDLVDWGCGCWLGFIPATIQVSGGKDPKGSIIKKWRNPNGRYSVQYEVTYN
ncbi:MAG TPA: hypothetical protein VEK07_12470 [Polyangiaceae bacterium]|nr:hypothetical protein [Polyangiaceae bacterium]